MPMAQAKFVFVISSSGLVDCEAIGMILTWPLERATPDFEHAFMRFVSGNQRQTGRRRFGLKRPKVAPDGTWWTCDQFLKVGLHPKAF